MKVYDVPQGTQEWLRLRAGIPTASAFDRILTPKGKESTQRERYLLTLLAERCMGHPVIEQVSMWMARGSELEAEAVSFYELQADEDTQPAGFVTNDEGTIGASPDRFVGEHGLLEIKCPSEAVHMSYLLKMGSVYEAYKLQVQGQLWLTERNFVDVLSFHPELPSALIRMDRDPDCIAVLSKAVLRFSQELETVTVMAEEFGWIKPKQAREQLNGTNLAAIQFMRETMREMK